MNAEAWSSGELRIEIEGGYLPVIAAIECMRINALVYVVARAEAKDPAFSASFPIEAVRVVFYPALSLAKDPLVELGDRVARDFMSQLWQIVKGNLEARALAALEMQKLAKQSQSPETIVELGQAPALQPEITEVP